MGRRLNGDQKNTGPLLELLATRDAFAAGALLTGIVVLRSERPFSLFRLKVLVEGLEVPECGILHKFRNQPLFFTREWFGSGIRAPLTTYERLSFFWNCFLGRIRGKNISAGEHIYPFAVHLPGSLPPSYSGSAGTVEYRVTAQLQRILARPVSVARVVNVVSVPRAESTQPLVLMYPSRQGVAKKPPLKANLEVQDPQASVGGKIRGRFEIHNAEKVPIRSVCATLEVYEWLRGIGTGKASHRIADRFPLMSDALQSDQVCCEFELQVPSDAVPTVEGTIIRVNWILRLFVESEPPVELKVPLRVFNALPG
ncbi:MAG: hypothetical protein ACUVRS_10720 [Armatimonadota bacterium]